MLNQDTELEKTFTITVDIRDSQGKSTGKRRTYSSDSAYKIWAFWMKNRSTIKHSKKTKLPTEQEANKILQTIYGE